MAGSIEKRGPNTYRLVVSAGTGPGGKRKKYTKTIKTTGKTEAAQRKETELELAKFVAEIEGNNFVKTSKLTFESFSIMWIENYACPNLAPKTIHTYKLYLKKHITPYFGHMNLSKIKPLHLLDFYRYLQNDYKKKDGTSLSNNTIIKYNKLLKVMFKSALEWGLIQSNPADNVKPPKYIKPDKTSYNKEEVKRLLIALKDEPIKYQATTLIPLNGGFRLGEVVGLEWENINFEDNTIKIKQANQYIPGEEILTKEPKTEQSKRTISMPQYVIDLLSLHKAEEIEKQKQCGELWKGEDIEKNKGFVFTQWNGKPMHPLTPTKWFNKFLKRKGLKKITYHELRHTAASILIGSGQISLKGLSEWLGHSETTTTANIYIHELEKVDKIASQVMNEIIYSEDKEKL